jgi:hypothetical protein
MLLIRTTAKFLSGLLDSMRSESFGLDVRRLDQGRPFLDLALDKFLEIFGRPALGRNQNGAVLQAYPLEISKVVVRSIMEPIGARGRLELLSRDENADD